VVGGTSTSRRNVSDWRPIRYILAVLPDDSAGFTSTAALTTFDTFSPANYTWESEDYDYGGGLFVDNPRPMPT